MSLPLRERGLKSIRDRSTRCLSLSLPSRERGLKSAVSIPRIYVVHKVAPLVGATIEIEKTIVYNVLCDYIEGGYLLSKTVRQSDWAAETLMEAPFWRNGMTPEEYEMENRHLSKNFYKQKDGNYMPLWMQEENMKA